jgi:hypothetical protein
VLIFPELRVADASLKKKKTVAEDGKIHMMQAYQPVTLQRADFAPLG